MNCLHSCFRYDMRVVFNWDVNANSVDEIDISFELTGMNEISLLLINFSSWPTGTEAH